MNVVESRWDHRQNLDGFQDSQLLRVSALQHLLPCLRLVDLPYRSVEIRDPRAYELNKFALVKTSDVQYLTFAQSIYGFKNWINVYVNVYFISTFVNERYLVCTYVGFMDNEDSSTKANTATNVALKEIKELIFSGELVSGSNHLETELATRLGISRTPIREAALILEGKGLLEVQPRKGIRIKSISINDMKEIYEVLTELEGLAARLAALFKYRKADLMILANAIKDMDVALRKNKREAWASADERFHAELVRLGGNTRIIDIINTYNDQVRRARIQTLYLRPLPTQSNVDHQELYDAIRLGEAAKAERLHRKHRKYASKLLIQIMESIGTKRH